MLVISFSVNFEMPKFELSRFHFYVLVSMTTCQATLRIMLITFCNVWAFMNCEKLYCLIFLKSKYYQNVLKATKVYTHPKSTCRLFILLCRVLIFSPCMEITFWCLHLCANISIYSITKPLV